MPRLEISLLGPFQVRLDGVPVTRFGADTARALLAYLVVDARTPRRREALAGLLWPDHPESEARHNLSQALLRLRAAIGDRDASPPFLLSTRETIQLHPDSETRLDVDSFSQAIAASKRHGHRRVQDCAACAEQLRKAIALYRGDFLAEFSLPSALFEAWLVVQREHLHGQALEALAALAAYHEGCGEYGEAIEYARRQVALEPWREEAHRQWMRALALSGQRSAALAQYATCARILRAELGVEPAQETTALVERIRDGSALHPVPVAPTPTSNLPAQSTPFVGRKRELAAVDGLIEDRDVRLVTVVGPGGMGKTRLALEVAQQALAGFPAGAWWVDLAPLPTEASVPRAVAAALGVLEQPDRPLHEIIADSLQTRELLLVLDNCEHVVEGVARLVATLVSRCPELTVLATSREPLHAPGEHLYEVPPMGLPGARETAERLLDADAVQLFGQRAAAVRSDFRLEENAALVAEVCYGLDGMPLAIELAAARLRALSLAEVAARLDDRFRLLTSGSRTAHPRQQTLHSTIAWSVNLLDDAERALFARLSVFAGSFHLKAAGEICSGEEVPAAEVLDRLTGLVDKSLVTVLRAEDGAMRYRLLETLRAYARERLAARGETDEIAAQHAWYYLALAERLEPQLLAQEREMLSAFARLDAEANNLAAAMRWSLSSQQPEVALRVGSALRYWLDMRLQHLVPYAEWLERALKQRGTGDPERWARALGVVFRAALFQDDDNRAAGAAEEALALARRTENPRLLGRAMADRGCADTQTGQPERARALYQEALQIGREHGNPMLVCAALEGLAYLERDPAKRYPLMEKLLAQAPHCLQVFPIQHLGRAAAELGDLERSEAWYRSGMERYVELGALHGQGDQLRWLASIARLRGDYDRAAALLERSIVLARQAGILSLCALINWLMGMVAWSRSDLVQAARYEELALDLSRQNESDTAVALAHCVLALVACEEGAYDRAEALCAGVPDNFFWGSYSLGLAFSAWARVALRRGDPARAVDLGREAVAHMRRHQCRPNTVEAIEPLTWALAAHGQAGKAARLLAYAARERAEMGMVLPPIDQPYHERAVDAVRAALGERAFAAAWAEGEALDLDEVIAPADPNGLCTADR
jgi:predicted ATPase/DNA-binding SARP family transcriptional activator